MKERIWIVGGSSGIGLELVKIWLESGHPVIASAQNASHAKELMALKHIYESKLQIIDIDVTSMESVSKAVHQAWKRFGGIDIWFYNAAVYEVMSINQWNIAHFESMVQVNYLGAVRVMTELIPYFEMQKNGRWVWNASLSSYFGLPLGGGYSAPKAALVNLAESLQPELKAKGINLQIINHGFVKTKLTEKNTFEMPELMEPEEAAQRIIDGIGKQDRFEIHFPFKLSTVLQFLRILPYRISLALTKKMLPK
ncbi:MAG TPA: SDR family NAD(P)-dependent oxidoreductase [Sulfurovum sp.]